METYLVYADAINNSNKFWSAKLEGNNVIVEWGENWLQIPSQNPQFQQSPTSN